MDIYMDIHIKLIYIQLPAQLCERLPEAWVVHQLLGHIYIYMYVCMYSFIYLDIYIESVYRHLIAC